MVKKMNKKTLFFPLPKNEYFELISKKESELKVPFGENMELIYLLKQVLHELNCNTNAFLRWYKNNESKPIKIKLSTKTPEKACFAKCEATFTIKGENVIFHILSIIDTKEVSILQERRAL